MNNSSNHHRRSIRLPGFDYSLPGAYFITICAHERQCIFGEVIGGEMRLNELGSIVFDEWEKTAVIRANVELGAFVVMPNHFHAIVHIVGESPAAELMENAGGRGWPLRTNAKIWKDLENRYRGQFQQLSDHSNLP